MKGLDFFVRYDRRREAWRVTPVGWMAAALLAMLALGSLVGLARAVGQPLHQVPQPAAAPAVPMSAQRPITWTLQAESLDGQAVRYVAPAEVDRAVIHDFTAAVSWWLANRSDPETMLAGLGDYFCGPQLAFWQRAARADLERGRVRLAAERQAEPTVQVTGYSADGQRAYLAYTLPAGQSAEYRLPDLSPVAGSQEALPARRVVYQLVFEPASRRWLIEENLICQDVEPE